jgi:hypothetical protein
MGEARHVEKQAEEATSAFLRRSSLTYLEVCIAVMLTHMPLEDVAVILEQEARDLRGFG